mgnify:CR=1 FL=1
MIALPFYEYKCSTCGESFELMQSMSEDPLERCKAAFCERTDGKRKGNGRIKRQLFAPAIHFKGTGFHNTDYASKRRGGGDDGGDAAKKSGGESSDSGGSKDSGSSSSSDSGGSKDSGSSKKTVGLDKV